MKKHISIFVMGRLDEMEQSRGGERVDSQLRSINPAPIAL